MKKLQLPINNTVIQPFRSDLSDLTPIRAEDGSIRYPLGNIDFKVTGEQTNEARQNVLDRRENRIL